MARKKRNNANELEELDRAYESLTGTPISRRNNNAGAVLLCIFLSLLLLACIGVCVFLQSAPANSLDRLPDVSVNGISLKGMTRAKALEILQAMAQTYVEQPMVVKVMDESLEISPEDAGISPDMVAAVDAILESHATGSFDLLPYLQLDTNAIRAAVDRLGKKYNRELSQSTATVTGERPSLTPEHLLLAQGAQNLHVTMGQSGYGLDTQTLYEQVVQAYRCAVFHVETECSVVIPKPPDLDGVYKEYCIPPTNAQMDPETFEILPEAYGYGFDLEAAKAQIADAAPGQTLTFPFRVITPQISADTLTASLFSDVLGKCRTPYVASQTSRNANLALACQTLDGMILYPGETFSYNAALGERTPEAGYLPAPSYVGGLTVDTYGGGICQVSSTLYYSTLLADLKINERYNHGYISSYIDPGMDATVSWGGGDFRFTNNTGYPIRIEAWVDDSHVNVQLVGTDDKDYYVEMHYNILSSTPYDTIYQEMPPDNEHGYKDGEEIVSPYKGYKVKAYKYKYSKETKELLSKELESNNTYNKRDRVLCKIVTPAEPE